MSATDTAFDASAKSNLVVVEVAYGTAERQCLIALQVAPGTTALEAVRLSGLLGEFPEIDPECQAMGIFSRLLGSKTLPPPDRYEVAAGDRIEVYRPLKIDPKQARLLRARRSGGKAR